MADMEKNTLYIKTFGGFELIWNGRIISGGSSESQFSHLMQMLLHSGRGGVARDKLEEMLFGDREINNRHHAAQSVVYNTKKQLKKLGLPDVNYIELKQKVFYWTEEIPTEEDAAKMERLAKEAEETDLPKKQLELYLEACMLYRGEFLGNHAGVLWIAAEARKYHALFCRCMEHATSLLRVHQDFQQMEELGRHASNADPLADWESVTMEALVSMERYDDARKLYEDTADFYFREQGLKPSKELLELLEKLANRMKHQHAVLDDIQKKLSENEEGQEPGGYLCSYPVFCGVYRLMERLMERSGQAVYLMLCTIVDGKGNPMRESTVLDELSKRLEKAICRSVRHSDTVNHYGKGQYLVLLVNTTLEDCEIVQRRINRNFIVGRQRTGIQYHVNSVVCPYDG